MQVEVHLSTATAEGVGRVSKVVLRDGRVSEFRVLRVDEEDRQIVRDLFHRASSESMYFRRFHAAHEVSERLIDDILSGDGVSGLGMACMMGDRAVGVGTYTRVNPQAAEVAMLVDDAVQGRGIGTLLLEHLADIARRNGFRQFTAHVLADNQKMIQVFVSSGCDLVTSRRETEVEFTLPLIETERRQALQDARDKFATITSLEPFLHPHTVAVVAADASARRMRSGLLSHLREGYFAGRAFAARAADVIGDTAVPLVALPGPIDLAVLVGAPERMPSLIEECRAAGVRGVVIASAGFAEQDRAGAQLQRQIVHQLRSSGIRLLGPNSLGVVSTAPDVRCNVSFAENLPEPGELAIASQSGSLGLAMMRHASRNGIGVSSFVSMGNKADISGNDLLQVWEDDPNTRIIALYLESFGNPQKFARLARRITRHKPIIVVKGARSKTGLIVSEATQPTLAMRDDLVQALFAQTGIIQVESVQELLETAALLAMCPPAMGRRVAVVTNTAGGAVMAVDCLQQNGLELAKRPVDLSFTELGPGYELALSAQLDDEQVDAVLVTYVCAGFADEAHVLKSIAAAVRANHLKQLRNGLVAAGSARVSKPVVVVVMTEEMEVRYIYADGDRIPVYPFPEQAIRSLAHAVYYQEWTKKPAARLPDLATFNRAAAESVVTRVLDDGRQVLTALETRSLLYSAGIASLGVNADNTGGAEHALCIEVRADQFVGALLRVATAGTPVPGGDVFCILPLTDVDAKAAVELVQERIYGARLWSPAVSLEFTDVLLRLSALVTEVAGIDELCLSGVGPCSARDALRIDAATARVNRIVLH